MSEESFRTALEHLINAHSAENSSGTPDFVLAQFMHDSLSAFDSAVRRRDEWWGFDPKIGGSIPAVDALESPVGSA